MFCKLSLIETGKTIKNHCSDTLLFPQINKINVPNANCYQKLIRHYFTSPFISYAEQDYFNRFNFIILLSFISLLFPPFNLQNSCYLCLHNYINTLKLPILSPLLGRKSVIHTLFSITHSCSTEKQLRISMPKVQKRDLNLLDLLLITNKANENLNVTLIIQ